MTDHGGHVVCRGMPCELKVSRETCFGYDSSSGYLVQHATGPDGRSADGAWVTCDLHDGEVLRLEYGERSPPADGR